MKEWIKDLVFLSHVPNTSLGAFIIFPPYDTILIAFLWFRNIFACLKSEKTGAHRNERIFSKSHNYKVSQL